ncbi:MAG TPA: SPFH domain-containing protein [Candidatus Competibacter denitrificans]|nr:SPFH domain-containing protein [Candidatus Competibacter denitrificans]
MFFVKSTPNEYLIVGHGGRIRNLGPAASAFQPSWATHVLVPSTQQEAIFEMRQESRDGIPLRFKGSALYRIVDPVRAARLYNFSAAGGVAEINTHIRGVCLFALREQVSHMTMVECMEQRKSTLTETVASALRPIATGGSGELEGANLSCYGEGAPLAAALAPLADLLKVSVRAMAH